VRPAQPPLFWLPGRRSASRTPNPAHSSRLQLVLRTCPLAWRWANHVALIKDVMGAARHDGAAHHPSSHPRSLARRPHPSLQAAHPFPFIYLPVDPLAVALGSWNTLIDVIGPLYPPRQGGTATASAQSRSSSPRHTLVRVTQAPKRRTCDASQHLSCVAACSTFAPSTTSPDTRAPVGSEAWNHRAAWTHYSGLDSCTGIENQAACPTSSSPHHRLLSSSPLPNLVS